MRRTFWISLFCVFSLAYSVIYPTNTTAAPHLTALGQIKEGLSVPTRLDVDDRGNLYIADPRQKLILVFDKFGKRIAEFFLGDLSGGGLAVTADGQKIYAACGQSVCVLDPKNLASVERLGNAPDTFAAVGFIDIAADGRIYVADTQRRLIQVFNPDGEMVDEFGDAATPTGRFASIFALAIDPLTAEIYVADSVRSSSHQSKIMVFSPEGEQRRVLVSDDESIFGSPALFFFGGIAFDQEGHGYFLDTYRSNARIVRLPQAYQSSLAMPSLLPGNMERPVDAAFDPLTKRLFVACDGGRVEVFGLNGATNPNPNSPPGPPVLFYPIAGSEVDSSTPELVFKNAEDPDNDLLQYDVRLWHKDKLVAEYADLPYLLPTSLAQVDRNLEENAEYKWSARAKDASTISAWTERQSFFVNAVEEAPETPEIIIPEEPPILDGAGKLAWQASSDPDPYDSISYRLEVFEDQAANEPILVHELADVSVRLSELPSYRTLKDSNEYFWHVTALDNHGLSSPANQTGCFIYDTTLLRIEANVGHARVYIGGNHAYQGRFAGLTPLELRDFPAGATSIVIEAAGYEPEVRQVSFKFEENLTLVADLRPALEPTFKLAKGAMLLRTGRSGLAPFFVDYDHDGLLDMLAGEAGGDILLALGVPAEGELIAFAQAVSLDLPLMPGAAPFVVDWNNDHRKDLLIGSEDGTIRLFLNHGSESGPVFRFDSTLHASETLIAVTGRAVPFVIDMDGNHNKDLIVGTGDGEVLYYRNLSLDESPQLAPARLLAKVSDAAVPFAVDWNADGRRDLVIATGGELLLCLQTDDAIFATPTKLYSGKNFDQDKGRKANNESKLLGDRPSPFLFDVDAMKGKDALIGTDSGDVLLLRSDSKTSDLDKDRPSRADADRHSLGNLFLEKRRPDVRPRPTRGRKQ